MKPKNRFLYLIVLMAFSALPGCKTTGLTKVQQIKQFEKMEWISGTWQNVSPEMTLTESWVKISDTLFRGKTAMIFSGDTLFTEDIKLAPSGTNIYYTTVIVNSGKKSTASYLLTKNTSRQMILEDPKNTSQSKIIYARKSADLMILKLEGIDQGKPSVETYRMSRR